MIDQQRINSLLSDAVNGALRELGAAEVETIRSDISVPVGRDLFGVVIQRSVAGEPPRMETGELRDNIKFEVVDEDGPVLYITSARPSSPEAPYNLEAMSRPYMSAAVERLEGYAASLIADHLARSL